MTLFPEIGAVLNANIKAFMHCAMIVDVKGVDAEVWCSIPEFRLMSTTERHLKRVKRVERKQGHIKVEVVRADPVRKLIDVRLIKKTA